MSSEEIAVGVLDAIVTFLGRDWIAKQAARLFGGDPDKLAAILEAEYKAAELAAELAEKKAFPG